MDATDAMERFREGRADKDTLRVLLATDNHLGVHEDDPVRCEDSFRTMDEIMGIGRECHVDMVLLGGDLFHINKPTRGTMSRAVQIFRKHCLGQEDVELVVRGKFAAGNTPNFEDENTAVDLPVFIIHGNHDDPTREGASLRSLSAIDILSEAGLVNYFGKQESVEKLEVEPVLIEKGLAKLKLYGIGWIRDQRLNHMFANEEVTFKTLPHTSGDGDEDDVVDDDRTWFKMLMVHQNRDAKGRGSKNSLSERMIPECMDFVMFGHEHECLIEPQEGVLNEHIQLCQPGSSVATTLSEAEQERKHVGIMEISLDTDRLQPKFELTKIPLRTVRPFVMEEFALSSVETLDANAPEKDKLRDVEECLTQKVTEMIERAKAEFREANPQTTPQELEKLLPLVRLRIEYTGFLPINMQRFAVKFVNKVANPNELLQFYRKRAPVERAETTESLSLEDFNKALGERDRTPQERINLLVEEVLSKATKKLTLLTEHELNESVLESLEKSKGANVLQSFLDEKLVVAQRNYLNQFMAVKERDNDEEAGGDDAKDDERIKAIIDADVEQRSRQSRAALRAKMAEAEAGAGAADGSELEDEDEGIEFPKRKRTKAKRGNRQTTLDSTLAAPRRGKSGDADGTGRSLSDEDMDLETPVAECKPVSRRRGGASRGSSSPAKRNGTASAAEGRPARKKANKTKPSRGLAVERARHTRFKPDTDDSDDSDQEVVYDDDDDDEEEEEEEEDFRPKRRGAAAKGREPVKRPRRAAAARSTPASNSSSVVNLDSDSDAEFDPAQEDYEAVAPSRGRRQTRRTR